MFWEELLKQTTETSRMNDIAIQLNTSTMQVLQYSWWSLTVEQTECLCVSLSVYVCVG